MPGPVDSPSSDAIEASVNQTKSEYLYFVANVEDGKVYFATTKKKNMIKTLQSISIASYLKQVVQTKIMWFPHNFVLKK